MDEMRQTVVHFPFLAEVNTIDSLEGTSDQFVPKEDRPAFELRLKWLRQIAREQKREEQSQ
jgi:hypothetical protein